MTNANKIPTVVSYSRASLKGKEQQFGSNLSEDAVVMVNTKLELDVQNSKMDELESLLHALQGMKNLTFRNVEQSGGVASYTAKNPEAIITFYLTKVFKAFSEFLDKEYKIEVSNEMRSNMPVDLVITVPAVSLFGDCLAEC